MLGQNNRPAETDATGPEPSFDLNGKAAAPAVGAVIRTVRRHQINVLPITVAACAETGALGAAIAAGVGAGLFPDLPAGVQAMTQRNAAFTPDPAMTRHYNERYFTYRMLTEALIPVWHRMAAALVRA